MLSGAGVRTLIQVLTISVVATTGGGVAGADVTRCSSGSAALAFDAADLGSLSNLSGNTGWLAIRN